MPKLTALGRIGVAVHRRSYPTGPGKRSSCTTTYSRPRLNTWRGRRSTASARKRPKRIGARRMPGRARMFFAFNPVTRTLPLHFACGSRHQGGRGDHFRSRSDRRRGRKQEEEGRHRWRRHQTHAQLPPLRRDVPVRRDRRSGGRATRWADPPVYVRPVPRLLEEIRRTFVVRQLTEVRADDR